LRGEFFIVNAEAELNTCLRSCRYGFTATVALAALLPPLLYAQRASPTSVADSAQRCARVEARFTEGPNAAALAALRRCPLVAPAAIMHVWRSEARRDSASIAALLEAGATFPDRRLTFALMGVAEDSETALIVRNAAVGVIAAHMTNGQRWPTVRGRPDGIASEIVLLWYHHPPIVAVAEPLRASEHEQIRVWARALRKRESRSPLRWTLDVIATTAADSAPPRRLL
jgi:hypothetical protein